MWNGTHSKYAVLGHQAVLHTVINIFTMPLKYISLVTLWCLSILTTFGIHLFITNTGLTCLTIKILLQTCPKVSSWCLYFTEMPMSHHPCLPLGCYRISCIICRFSVNNTFFRWHTEIECCFFLLLPYFNLPKVVPPSTFTTSTTRQQYDYVLAISFHMMHLSMLIQYLPIWLISMSLNSTN